MVRIKGTGKAEVGERKEEEEKETVKSSFYAIHRTDFQSHQVLYQQHLLFLISEESN